MSSKPHHSLRHLLSQIETLLLSSWGAAWFSVWKNTEQKRLRDLKKSQLPLCINHVKEFSHSWPSCYCLCLTWVLGRQAGNLVISLFWRVAFYKCQNILCLPVSHRSWDRHLRCKNWVWDVLRSMFPTVPRERRGWNMELIRALQGPLENFSTQENWMQSIWGELSAWLMSLGCKFTCISWEPENLPYKHLIPSNLADNTEVLNLHCPAVSPFLYSFWMNFAFVSAFFKALITDKWK